MRKPWPCWMLLPGLDDGQKLIVLRLGKGVPVKEGLTPEAHCDRLHVPPGVEVGGSSNRGIHGCFPPVAIVPDALPEPASHQIPFLAVGPV